MRLHYKSTDVLAMLVKLVEFGETSPPYMKERRINEMISQGYRPMSFGYNNAGALITVVFSKED
ncbi:MAG: hypothetical protein DRN20_00040 [Thermoplasmata archaeon]|nr:MAG: hypothetical protein DRN20_00040 [Thermoplasmata archaeon]